jgi:hypothetical protein
VFVDTATEFEKYQTILETVEGSSLKASKSMEWISNFATTTPYEIGQVTDAFVKLRAYGLDPTDGLLRTLGDTGSAMGKTVNQAVEAMADAVTGENERLKEFGIKARASGETITYEYTHNGETQTKSVSKSDRKAIQDTLSLIFNEKYAGAMDKQSKTFEGMVSNIMDQWTRFKLMVMKSGVFDEMKKKLSGFLDKINELGKNGQLQEYAEKFGKDLLLAFKQLYKVGLGVASVFKKIGGYLETAADFLGGWNNLATAMVAIKLAPVIMSIVTGVIALTGAMAGLSISMLGVTVPILAVVAGITAIAALAYVVYDNWGGIKNWFMSMFDSIKVSFLKFVKTITKFVPDNLLGESLQSKNLDKSIAKLEKIKNIATINAPKQTKTLLERMNNMGLDGVEKKIKLATLTTVMATMPAVAQAQNNIQKTTTINAPITISGAINPADSAQQISTHLQSLQNNNNQFDEDNL